MTNLMSVFEIIGSIAFAISGSMLAIKKEMDLFGILILGIVTSVGGGAIRDIVIGNTPPAMFQNPKCTVISSITAVVVFIIWKIHNRHAVTEKIARRTDIMYHNLLFLSDTLGLAAFTILGMETTIRFLNTDQFLLIAFVGLITGVGGGILRDLLGRRDSVCSAKTHLRHCMHLRYYRILYSVSFHTGKCCSTDRILPGAGHPLPCKTF